MSRIGKKPLAIPSGVTVTITRQTVVVTGPKGTMTRTFHPHVTFTREGDVLSVSVKNPEEKSDRALWGLSQKLLSNMIQGVQAEFLKKLELVGVGYRAQVSGKTLVLNIGYSHPVELPIPDDLSVSVEKNTFLTVRGIDKEHVGNFAAAIRAWRKPEPYKGKGIKYEGEFIRRKVGKAAKTAGAA